jgi:enoyl-CoA hydratase
MNLTFNTLQLAIHSEHTLMVTLNRPASRNAMNTEMMQELHDLWNDLIAHSTLFQCVILTGSDPAFCAGADLKERQQLTLDQWREQRAILESAMLAMIACPIPIIAAVNGAAFGGGLELLLACDFAYASTSASFSQSEVRVGLMPGAMGTQHLPKACGLNRAKELTFTGEVFSANDALNWGIVNKVCEPTALLNEVLFTANTICKNAPLAIKAAKIALSASAHLDIQSGFDVEVAEYNKLLPTADKAEGIAAFNEKRVAVFKGC